jgi:hypothetical protein
MSAFQPRPRVRAAHPKRPAGLPDWCGGAMIPRRSTPPSRRSSPAWRTLSRHGPRSSARSPACSASTRPYELLVEQAAPYAESSQVREFRDGLPEELGRYMARHCCIERSPRPAASTRPPKQSGLRARSRVPSRFLVPPRGESLHCAGLSRRRRAQCNSASVGAPPGQTGPVPGPSNRPRPALRATGQDHAVACGHGLIFGGCHITGSSTGADLVCSPAPASCPTSQVTIYGCRTRRSTHDVGRRQGPRILRSCQERRTTPRPSLRCPADASAGRRYRMTWVCSGTLCP